MDWWIERRKFYTYRRQFETLTFIDVSSWLRRTAFPYLLQAGYSLIPEFIELKNVLIEITKNGKHGINAFGFFDWIVVSGHVFDAWQISWVVRRLRQQQSVWHVNVLLPLTVILLTPIGTRLEKNLPSPIVRGIGNFGARIVEDIRSEVQASHNGLNRRGWFDSLFSLTDTIISLAVLMLVAVLAYRLGDEIGNFVGGICVLKTPEHHIPDASSWGFKIIYPDCKTTPLCGGETHGWTATQSLILR